MIDTTRTLVPAAGGLSSTGWAVVLVGMALWAAMAWTWLDRPAPHDAIVEFSDAPTATQCLIIHDSRRYHPAC